MPLQGLAPERVWRHFADLSALPRCSKDEARALAHLENLADGWGLAHSRDAAGNLLILKPAHQKDGAPVLLQAHVDMVCEQDRGRGHDFTCDGLELVVDGGWVRAEGTTLGADNGVGVALLLAVLEDKTLVHGPLEAVFTVDEETDMSGAAGLALDLQGRTILNLDGEGEGQFFVGSAGGGTSTGRLPLGSEPYGVEAGWVFELGGLPGGHSGVDIHKQVGNALSLAARFASALLRRDPRWRLVSVNGGDKDNAIPREAALEFAGPEGPPPAAELQALFAAELGPQGSSLFIETKKQPAPDRVLDRSSERRFLDLLLSLPDGVQAMSRAVPGLVETSCNLANIRTNSNEAVVIVSERSSEPTQLEALFDRVEAVFRLAGGNAERGAWYPSWPARPGRLAAQAPALWERHTGTAAEVLLVHAGLECGWLAAKFPGADMISFGPNIVDAHTPRERVEVASVERVFGFLKTLLETL